MFSNKEFIEVSRKFVCVRLDSYESATHQEWVRRFLNGRFENSCFCILAPDGKDWLTRSGRGPHQVFGAEERAIAEMTQIAAGYKPSGDLSQAVVEDFHSVRQALNVASADQRMLVLIAGPQVKLAVSRKSLRIVASHKAVIGRYHFDFEDQSDWRETVTQGTLEHGIFMIQSGEFGMDGKVLLELSLDAEPAEILTALEKARAAFVAATPKKVYRDHVEKGGQLGVYFEGAVPYGEDRDADGQIDRVGRRRGPRGGRGSQ